jgi:hypothetical protein
MRILMMAVLLLVAMPVAAQNWVKVDENDVFTLYIDPSTIRINGNLRRVWTLNDFKRPDPGGQVSQRALLEYDCKEERSRVLAWSAHSESMLGGKILYSKDEPGQWRYVAPGSVADVTLKIVCAVRQ